MQMVNSLGVVTYFCADASVETEKSMRILWDFIHQQGGTNVCMHLKLHCNFAVSSDTDIIVKAAKFQWLYMFIRCNAIDGKIFNGFI